MSSSDAIDSSKPERTRMDWLSDVKRPTTGEDVPLLIFRAFRHFTADYVIKMMGRGANVVFQNGGRDLGREAGKLLMKPNLDDYLGEVIRFVRDQKVGIILPQEVSETRLVLGLDECITCAGVTPIGQRICHFETGFVAGLVEAFVGHRVRAHESKCNCMGEGICEVSVDLVQ